MSRGERRLCTFLLGEERYAIDILSVREIQRDVAITPTPGSPAHVRGLMNLRGQIVTVIDPSVCLGQARREATRACRLVILKTNAELKDIGHCEMSTADDLLGLWVDSVGDVVTLDADAVETPPTDAGAASEQLLAGVVQHAEGLLRVLDLSGLLQPADGA
jgi:purine-binding chemotaxis protein CheW